MADQFIDIHGHDEAPDLFLGSHDLIGPLVLGDFIQPITNYVDDTQIAEHLEKSIDALRHDDALYGVPQSLDVMALYYNADLVSAPVSTLDELIAAAAPNKLVILDRSFYGAYWGISAFGDRLIDDQGQLIGNRPGFVEWLAWLKEAHANEGIILSNDQGLMQQLFMAGQVAYLVAGPLLRVNAFMFNSMLDQKQLELAVRFASFASSPINQTRLRKEFTTLPTNRMAAETAEDSAILTFVKQATETAIILPHTYDRLTLDIGDTIYERVFADQLQPIDAVNMLIRVAENVDTLEPLGNGRNPG
ncbi:extracellular solute-binding protein [Chloroflexi bacterium TSY]|nr:extracellular solute-binding protein [Chloroflexi bacterium TSY]